MIGQSVRVPVGDDGFVGLPDDPSFVQALGAFSDGGYWATAVDRRWRVVFLSEESQRIGGGGFLLGEFFYSRAQTEARLAQRGGFNTIESVRDSFRTLGRLLLADFDGDRDELRNLVHPELRDLVDEIEPSHREALYYELPASAFGGNVGLGIVAQRIRDASGRLVGTIFLLAPTVGMGTLFMLAGVGDPEHFRRMQQFATPDRRSAAILFADLEGSTALAKRLPTASYFALIRRLTRTMDRCVVEAGGLVGRHIGDGVTAFFAAESNGSESAAACACIATARAVQTACAEVAAQHGLAPGEAVMRVGLHWGTTLYIGSITTSGRSEVTALGEEVNEAARIEACATGGRALASKHLIERLDPADAAALGIDPQRVVYVQLADLNTATDKARRDAPSIPVADLSTGTP
jgi:class 3 adenylate cyclase